MDFENFKKYREKTFIKEESDKAYFNITFNLENKDHQEIGWAKMKFESYPVDHYYLSELKINNRNRGKGFGGILIEKVNQFLKEKGVAGVLQNEASSGILTYDIDGRKITDLSESFYKEHGWDILLDDGQYQFMIFNGDKSHYEKLREFYK